jgi:tRNA(Ile)-lysidine synthase TilS/MesJ
MAVQMDETEERRIEELVGEVEITVEENDSRKDLKERRGVMKQTLYDGSKKLKHIIPKGKHL